MTQWGAQWEISIGIYYQLSMIWSNTSRQKRDLRNWSNTFLKDTMILHWSVIRYEIIYFSAILDNSYLDRNADRDK